MDSFGASPFLNNNGDQVTNLSLSSTDLYIFWIGGTMCMILTFLLILGSIRFKELRKQPGDIIVGIALSDFVLSVLWIILASRSDKIGDTAFCVSIGAISTFAGTTELLYNVAFNIYLILSLRNALKQDKIPKKSFHVLTIGISAVYLAYLLGQNEIGETSSGTCSIKSEMKPWLSYTFAVLVAVCYAALGLYTFYYVRKNVPKCAKAHVKRTQFLLYYSRYVMASTIVYALIAITTILSIAFQDSFVNSLNNLAKLCSPLVVSFIRFRDPVIKKFMVKTVFFWKKTDKDDSKVLVRAEETHFKNSVNEDLANSGEFFINLLSSNLKVEITYTLLSCALYADFSQRNGIWESSSTFDRKATNLYKHERLHLIGEGAMRYLLPSVREELDRTQHSVLPGTLKVHAPELFMRLADEDRGYLNIQESLDFVVNREEIKNASAPGGGKSGEFFFFSRDKKLIIKTIPDVEMKMFVSILEQYDQHFKENPNSLIAKIYGAYTFESTEYEQKFNLIIMKNISGFPSQYTERIYDMKGSRYDRQVIQDPSINDKTLLKQYGVLKDLDFEKFEKKLNIKKELKEPFLKQVEADSLFFRRVKLIDYSFMVFCINKKKYIEEKGYLQDGFTAKNSLASLENTEEPGIYYNIGIVDYLQPFNFQKALERSIKKVRRMDLSLDTSSQDPEYYSTRFIEFIRKIV